MRRIVPLIIASLVVFAAPLPLFAADPAAAVAAARQHLQKREFAEALTSLGEAKTAVASLPEGDRVAPLTAIHFLSALALSEMGQRNEATAELRSFFRLRPAATVKEGTYPAPFMKLFESVRKEVLKEVSAHDSFDGAYPGLATFTLPPAPPVAEWGRSSEAILLGSDAEKAEWSRLTDDASRAQFIEAFWKRRDPHPATEVNELREEIGRRIAFADRAFDEVHDGHGALSDRGRVFVFIGKPHRVTTRPLTRLEATSVTGRGMRGGGVEVWEYRREQLPASVPTHFVEFRFIEKQSDPQRAMQKDFMPLAALEAARKAVLH